jgi:hypothetical protein
MSTAPHLNLTVRTLAEARAAAQRAAALCDQPQRAEQGLAELLVNAVEHGNLGIDHLQKARLLACGQWEAEIARRLADPVLGRRAATLCAWREAEGWCFEIADQGPGFDWLPWLEADPAHSAAPNGRGIALAAGLSFDSLAFMTPGNRVCARLRDGVPKD